MIKSIPVDFIKLIAYQFHDEHFDDKIFLPSPPMSFESETFFGKSKIKK
jgi:hypothetical protein